MFLSIQKPVRPAVVALQSLLLLGGMAPALAVADAVIESAASHNHQTDRRSDTTYTQDNRVADSRSTSVSAAVDNSRATSVDNRLALTRSYLIDRQYRHANQQGEQQRRYASDVGQQAGNQGQARGHTLGQQQGGVRVGALVSESGAESNAASRGFNWQFAPQSNRVSVAGDNNAMIQLSNINANGGNVHIGDVHKGNMYNSQIGNNQHGAQGGDSVNAQSNQQRQRAESSVASDDQASNSGGGS